MALSTKIGTFSTTTNVATTQVAVTGVGFQPSFVLFFATPPLTAVGVSDPASAVESSMCVGFAVSSTKRGYVALTDKDGQGTTATSRALGSDGCFGRNNAANTSASRMDFVSMDADGFTLVIDVAFGTSALVAYLAVGGTDVTGVDAGVLTATTGTGTQTVSGLTFAPTGCLLLCTGAGVVTDPNIAGGAIMGVGFASAAAQGCIQTRLASGAATTDTASIIMTNRVLGASNTTSDTLIGEYQHTGFTADGFTLDKTVDATSATKLLWIAWAGPQIKVGTTATRTDTSNQTVTGVGFQPSLLIFLGANGIATETTMSAHGNPCIGWATSSTERAASTLSSEDGLTDSDCQSYISTTRCVVKRKRTALNTYATAAEMDLVSMDADGFTLSNPTADSQATLLLYLALGAVAAGGGAPKFLPEALGLNHLVGVR